MSQNTYQRSKLLIQINDVARTESLWSWIISLANAKSKLILGIKSLFVNPFSKCFLHMLQQIKQQILLRKYFVSLQIKYELSPKIHS